MWEVVRRWGAFILFVSLILSIKDPGGETKKPSRSIWNFQKIQNTTITDLNKIQSSSSPSLEYDFYREKCPQAEEIIRSTTAQLYSQNSSVAPALLRLLFHDCFIQGCDGSVLLGRINGSKSEKEAIPNQTLKGFNEIETIKSKVEEICPAIVSCADILALAARDGAVMAGGPFYPVLTGRRDSNQSYFSEALSQIPTPNDTYAQTISNFGSRGFTERETVTLLGAHSIGTVHCRFFKDRLYNFSGTGAPDGSLDAERLEEMRAACGNASTTGDLDTEPGLAMGFRPEEQRERGKAGRFDSHYYNTLLEGKGILHSDQQLTAGRTVRWVKAYAEEELEFRSYFARAMAKLSGLSPLLGSEGQVRVHCSKMA